MAKDKGGLVGTTELAALARDYGEGSTPMDKLKITKAGHRHVEFAQQPHS